MDREQVEQIAHQAMSRRKAHLHREKGFVYRHGKRVAELSLNLRRRLFPGDGSLDECLHAGALFHDVTKGIEPHAQTGALLAESLLRQVCTPEELEIVLRIIREHNRRGQAEAPFYVKIVQDADILDHFGTQEIWLNFMHQAYDESGPEESVAYWASEDYANYLAKSRFELNYERSRKIFDEKEVFRRQFAERFALESLGGIGLE